ncbi:DJ-1/PfpI family protein [Bacillus solimangrovi]|uniref:ThiJ/PfpI family protein n=1 Tax=Bacillus solimangrovi TaxID=1305675 RepID=A0A1E5LG06_9BACI|nr:DJ-1/PfpI family protein [Bacillus solimangrovi]OEH93017.1 thiJ/PfpI family protein [Bacillus solimangrovi]
MKALFLLYDGYVEWEISTLSYILQLTNVEISTTAINEEVTHKGNFKVKVDFKVEDCHADDFDILIIPGGDPAEMIKEEKFLSLIQQFNEKKKWIAAICGAPTFLGAADVLRERKYSSSIGDEFDHYLNLQYKSETDVTVCENLITAEGNAYVEFAVAVGKQLTIFKDREDELETVLYFKNQLRG